MSAKKKKKADTPDPVEEQQQAEEPQNVEVEVEKTDAEKLAEQEEKFLRLQAEFQNFRKRSFRDISNVRTLTVESTISPFLQVFDHFSMAVAAANASDNMDAIRQGLNMILEEYSKALDSLGVTSFDAVGKEFDPNEHQAMAREASDEVPEGVVIKQWGCGYKMGEKLLRPANVVVSSGRCKEDEQEIDK